MEDAVAATRELKPGLVLTRAQRSALSALAWGQYYFGGLLTGGNTRRAVVLALCKKGLAESQGMVEQCDGDGFILHGRQMREAFGLTSAGLDEAVRLDCYYAKELVKRDQQKGLQ
ncbi:MAG: hypothetical protein O7G84_01100 [Gammaproteobacteria bacterium]|nr:hypothetical protein [Gammaproteobacteria bacterium]